MRLSRKDAQLCSQVGDAIDFALATSEDPNLDGLYVVDTVPAPNVGRLQVTLALHLEGDEAAQREKLELARHAVEEAAGELRFEVSESIHRKRTPSLHFLVIPAGFEIS